MDEVPMSPMQKKRNQNIAKPQTSQNPNLRPTVTLVGPTGILVEPTGTLNGESQKSKRKVTSPNGESNGSKPTAHEEQSTANRENLRPTGHNLQQQCKTKEMSKDLGGPTYN